MQLHLQTWPDVEAYLKDSHGIIIPIGSTEQHGPTGLIGTDALTAEMIGRGVGDKVGALVAPTISVGMAQHHLDFPGSMTVRPTTLIALIRDQVMSLARNGFTRFYFLNGHGGNIATVTASFSEIYAERSMERMSNQPPLKCVLRNWWESNGVTSLRREFYGGSEGSHLHDPQLHFVQDSGGVVAAAGRDDLIFENVAVHGDSAAGVARAWPCGRGLHDVRANQNVVCVCR